MLSSPRSPVFKTSHSRDHIGVVSLTPSLTAHTRPHFSPTNRRPSGRYAIDVGVSNVTPSVTLSATKSAGRSGEAGADDPVRHAASAPATARRAARVFRGKLRGRGSRAQGVLGTCGGSLMLRRVRKRGQ